MIKRIGLLVVVALVAVMMMVATAAPAFAASLSQTCEDAGGTWTKVGNGQFKCVFPATNPSDGNANVPPAATPKQDTTTQTGNGGGEERNNTSSNGCGQNNTSC